jgi:hypothetical protein
MRFMPLRTARAIGQITGFCAATNNLQLRHRAAVTLRRMDMVSLGMRNFFVLHRLFR